MNRFKAAVHDEVVGHVHLVEGGMQRIIAECVDWESRYTLEEVAQTLENLTSLLDAANVRHLGTRLDAGMMEKAEELVDTLSKHLARQEQKHEKAHEFKLRANELFSKVTIVDANSADDALDPGRVAIQKVLDEVDQFGEEDSDEDDEEYDPNVASRAWSVKGRSTIKDVKKSLHMAISMMDKGAEYLGLRGAERRGTVCIKAMLPLQETLNHLDVSDVSDIELLRFVNKRLQQYGYQHIEQLAEDETADINRHFFGQRMEKLGMMDSKQLDSLFQLLSPFTFANFRRLLNSPAVMDGVAN